MSYMEIGFDISALDERFKAHAHRGIGRYVRRLADYLSRLESDDFQVNFFSQHALACESPLSQAVAGLPILKNTLRQQIAYPLNLAAGGTSQCQLLHFGAHVDAPAWGVKNYAVMVHDLIPMIFPKEYGADRGNLRFKMGRWLETRAILNAAMIFCNSNWTKNDVHRLLNIPKNRIFVSELGMDEIFHKQVDAKKLAQVLQKYQLEPDRKFLFYTGGIDPRKNWRALVEIEKTLLQLYGDRGAPLLLVAGRIESDDQYPRLVAAINEHGLQRHVRLLGFVPDQELVALLSASMAFVFPSIYEGFGLPPLEAMACGTAVVSSNAACMPEILSDVAMYFDPGDIGAAIFAIQKLMVDPSLRSELGKRGREQACRFTWQATGEKTVAAYRSFADGQFHQAP